MPDILGLLRLGGTTEVDDKALIDVADRRRLRITVFADIAIVISFAWSRIKITSRVSAGSMRNAPEQSSSRDFPRPVRLQTAGEMIVLGVNRRPARTHGIFDFLALLVFSSEFFTQLDEP